MLVVLPLFPRYWLGPNLSQTQRGRDYEDILFRLGSVWLCGLTCFLLNFIFFVKIKCGLYFLDRFDVLISKMIFKK
jgi:hypothetical protein